VVRHLLRILRALWRSGLLHIPPQKVRATAGAYRRCGPSIMFLAELAAIRFPHRIALRDEHGCLTFAELVEQANHLAATLPGNGPVAILSRNHRGFVLALLAATRCGLDVLPVGAELPPAVLTQTLQRHHVRLLLHDPDLSPSFIPARPILPAPPAAVPPAQRRGNLVVLTSGTTGISKGIRRRPTLPQLLPIVAGLLEQLPFQMHRPLVLAIPLHHGYGLAALAMSLALAAPLHLAARYDIAPLLETVHEPALLVTVPTLLHRWEPSGNPRLAGIITGSAPLRPELAARILQSVGPILYNLYGSTEAGLVALATPQQPPGSVGRPLPGNRLRIVLPSGEPAPPGSTGRIYVSGPLVLSTDADGWRDTGDLGRLDSGGNLFIEGRADSMFVSGGENVFPHETEQLLASHPDILDVAILVVPDDEFGQRMLAAVVLRPGVTPDLKAWLRPRTTPAKLPKSFHPLPAIPRNPLGKVDRQALTRLLTPPDKS
jgi:acyl-CoA synthetase (AMP-forming)/AMP-acid ligase II